MWRPCRLWAAFFGAVVEIDVLLLRCGAVRRLSGLVQDVAHELDVVNGETERLDARQLLLVREDRDRLLELLERRVEARHTPPLAHVRRQPLKGHERTVHFCVHWKLLSALSLFLPQKKIVVASRWRWEDLSLSCHNLKCLLSTTTQGSLSLSLSLSLSHTHTHTHTRARS